MAWPALGQSIIEANLTCAFYGDLFRPCGKALAPFYDASDLDGEWQQELLLAWWKEADQLDPLVSGPDTGGKGIGGSVLQIDLRSIPTAGGGLNCPCTSTTTRGRRARPRRPGSVMAARCPTSGSACWSNRSGVGSHCCANARLSAHR